MNNMEECLFYLCQMKDNLTLTDVRMYLIHIEKIVGISFLQKDKDLIVDNLRKRLNIIDE